MGATTEYEGVSKFYFDEIINSAIRIGDLRNSSKVILDFGCGHQRLKQLSKSSAIVGYDINPNFSDIKDWRGLNFSTFVAIEVFYSMSPIELNDLMLELYSRAGINELIVGTSRLGLLNKIGMLLTGKRTAHDFVKTSPTEELAIISKYFKAVESRSIWGLCDVRKFKKKERLA